MPRDPQGHPVIAQAGASESGIDLAALHGEIIYCNILSRRAGQTFGNKVRDRAKSFGRDPSGIRIVPGLVAITADSYEEALRKHELLSGTGSEDGLLKRFATDFIPDPNRIQAVGMASDCRSC